MKIYNIEMMTPEDHHNYMMGCLFARTKHGRVQAENVEEAIKNAKAMYSDFIINEHYVKTDEEIEQEDQERRELDEKFQREEKERKELAKQRKIERDLAKGITPEMRKVMTRVSRKKSAIKKLKSEILEKQHELENLEKSKAKDEKFLKERGI